MSWTIETLKEHQAALFVEYEKRIEQRFADSHTALRTALEAADKRLDGMNEFRASLDDARRLQMPRSEIETQLKAVADRVDKLEATLTGSAGQQIGTKTGYGWAIGAVAVIAAILGVVSALDILIRRGAP